MNCDVILPIIFSLSQILLGHSFILLIILPSILLKITPCTIKKAYIIYFNKGEPTSCRFLKWQQLLYLYKRRNKRLSNHHWLNFWHKKISHIYNPIDKVPGVLRLWNRLSGMPVIQSRMIMELMWLFIIAKMRVKSSIIITVNRWIMNWISINKPLKKFFISCKIKGHNRLIYFEVIKSVHAARQRMRLPIMIFHLTKRIRLDI